MLLSGNYKTGTRSTKATIVLFFVANSLFVSAKFRTYALTLGPKTCRAIIFLKHFIASVAGPGYGGKKNWFRYYRRHSASQRDYARWPRAGRHIRADQSGVRQRR